MSFFISFDENSRLSTLPDELQAKIIQHANEWTAAKRELNRRFKIAKAERVETLREVNLCKKFKRLKSDELKRDHYMEEAGFYPGEDDEEFDHYLSATLEILLKRLKDKTRHASELKHELRAHLNN
jgi:hypothetical protein